MLMLTIVAPFRVAASAPLESGFVLAFAILFFGRKWPRYAALIFVPGVVLTLIGLFGSPEALRTSFLFMGIPAIGIGLDHIVIQILAQDPAHAIAAGGGVPALVHSP